MKNTKLTLASAGLLIAILLVAMTPGASAGQLFWDGGTVSIGTNGDGLSGGTAGNWDNALTNWDQGSGLAHVAWSAGSPAVFGGTAGTITLTDNISVGGLQFNTTAYTIQAATNSKTLSFAAGTDTILFNAIASATITGTVGGTGNVILTSLTNSVGTVTFNGTTTGGWSGSTTVNAGMTLVSDSVSGTNQILNNTSAININGGTVQFKRNGSTNTNLISDSAAITVNGGGTLAQTNNDAGNANAIETVGAVTVNSGQFNFNITNGGSSGSKVQFNGLTQGASTTAVTFSFNPSPANLWVNLNGGVALANTAAGQIIGPWATTGSVNGVAAQTDYAVYSGGNGTIASSGIAASAESTWSTDNTTLTGTVNNNLANAAGSAASGKLTATRNINSLRANNSVVNLTSIASSVITVTGSSFANGDAVQIGGTAPAPLANNTVYYVVNASGATFQLASAPGGTAITITGAVSGNIAGGVTLSSGINLGTFGILNANGVFLPIGRGTTGGVVTLPTTAAGNLFVNAGSAGIGIDAPITDNTGALTLVKNGSSTLFLTGTNTYTGGTVVNAGGLQIGSVNNIGGASAGLTFGGTATLTPTAALNFSGGTLTVNAGAIATINNNAAITFSSTTGTGVIIATQNGTSNVINVANASTFTGNLRAYAPAANNGTATLGLQFSALNDAVGSALQLQGGGSDSNQITTIALTSDVGQLTFNNRQVQILPRTTSNWDLYNVMLANNNTNTANTWVINTNLLNLSDRASQSGGTQEFTLRGTNTGNNAFNGVIGDGLGYTTITPTYLVKADAGRWIVSGSNTFTGGVILNNGTLSVGTINSSSVAGPLGMGTVQLGGIDRVGSGHGFGNNSGILEYTGSGQTTPRAFLIGDTTAADNGAGSILNNGSGALIFSAANFNSAIALITATRTLTLGGSYSAVPNEIQGVIQDNVLSTGKINVTKQNDASTWILSGTNPYTGTTTVSGGTLVVNGSLTATSSTSVASGATLRGGTSAQAGTVANLVTVTGAIWPGTSAVRSALVSGIEILNVGSINLSAGKLQTILKYNSGTLLSQQLVVQGTSGTTVTLGGTSTLSFASDSNTTTPQDYLVLDASANAAGFTTAFKTVLVTTLVLGTDYDVVYKAGPSDATPILQSSLGASTSLGSAKTQVYVRIKNSNVSPVKIADFAAKSEGSGVNISWTAVSEYQNAGFNIYRRALESAEWTKVNPTLIAGRITNPDERKYTYFDWASSGMYEYKLESIDVSGGREAYAKLSDVVNVDWAAELTPSNDVSSAVVDSAVRSIDMDYSAQTAQRVETVFAAARTADVNAAPKVAVRDLSARSTNDMAVVNNFAVRSAASAAKVQTPAVGLRWFSSGRIGTASNYTTAKVMYKNAGVMVIPQSSMPDGFDLGNVALQREGRNLNALAKLPAGLLVYAPGYKDNYTDKDAIFIRKSTNATNAGSPTVATGLFSSASPLNVTSSNTVTNDYHDVYFDYNLRPFSFEPWFSSKYLTQGSSQDFNVALSDVVSGSATMVVNLWSLTASDSVNPDHGIQVLVNGQAIGESSWDGGNKMVQLSFTIPASVLKTGDNVVSLVTPTLAGQDSQISFLHSISVSYTRGLEASKPVEITSTGGMYELYNIPATGAWVVDARFSDRASLVPTETQAQADGTLRLRFVAQSGGSGKYIVVPSGQENTPLSVSARMVKALKLNGTYLATGPAQFASGTQALLMKRAKEGIRGAYVDQEQLFDYYNYGRFGPDGIRNAVRSTKPTYLLLVGRTTYDYLNYEGQNIDPLCPAYLVSTNFWAQTTSDSAFGDLGRGYPEVAVGRLPVNNTTELSGAISHIVNYKGIPQSGIRLHAVADKADPLVADFGAQLDSAIKVSNPDITWQENYLEKTYATAPEVTAALKDAANGGADLIVYSGHGNAARLGAADPRILDQTSVQEWTGNTVFLQSTCTANWMAKNVDDYKSIAIQALTQSQGGISASIGTSTYMNSDVATAFMNQLLKNATGSGARWGSVLMKTQVWAGNQGGSAFNKDLMTTEQLFGDPAMPVYTKSAASTPSASSNAAGTF